MVPGNLKIALSGVEVATIMLHCKLTYEPKCKAEQNAFKNFLDARKALNSADISFVNGDGLNGEGLEKFLINFIWR
jgi:hypothetical protein